MGPDYPCYLESNLERSGVRRLFLATASHRSTKPSYSITGQYLTVQKPYVSYRESHGNIQSSRTEVAPYVVVHVHAKNHQKRFHCHMYKIPIVTIIVTVINRNGAACSQTSIPEVAGCWLPWLWHFWQTYSQP